MSREKGPLDITNSVDQDQPYTMLKTPIHNKSVYIARKISAIDVMIVKKCRPWPDAAAGLGLHFLHMSEGPFSHDAGHMAKFDIFFK